MARFIRIFSALARLRAAFGWVLGLPQEEGVGRRAD
jgi:hypothetical protein